MNRFQVPAIVSRLLQRPVRWAPPESLVGDFDGRDRTLQVFGVEAKDQRRLLGHLGPYLAFLEQSAGGSIVVVFLTTEQSLRYTDALSSAPREMMVRRIPSAGLSPLGNDCVDTSSPEGPRRRVA